MKARLLPVLMIGVAGLSLAHAGGPHGLPTHFRGLLNDYSPASVNGVTIKGGPYEMHGTRKLDIDEGGYSASFSAALTMQTVDFPNPSPSFDPGTLGAHTHPRGTVHDGPTDWVSMCPTLSPAVTGGFVVTGMAYVTANGSNPPFGNPSPVTICILGGSNPNLPSSAYVQF